MVKKLKTYRVGFEQDFAALLSARRSVEEDVTDTVRTILKDVRSRGDAAVIDYTARFDRLRLTPESMRISAAEIKVARKGVTAETYEALKLAAQRIETFHKRHLPKNDSYTDEAGVTLGTRWRPVQAAGIYVPGGKAVYPSSVLMNAIPARAAGVERLVMAVPAPDGYLNPLVLVAAELAGITEIYRIGGAQAIGALAFGTETIPPVDVITGPGNAYVAAAKREVFGQVGIDMIAGPSEILVVADNRNDPRWIAMDLLSQAEHDEVAQSILITDDEAFAEATCMAVEDHLATLPRANIARKSWDNHGVVLLVRDLMKEAPTLVDRLAPEHLELAVDSARDMAEKISHAGSIFLGRYTPEAIGDYVAGPNHVLPTDRTARFASGLSALNFMKRNTMIECSAGSLARIGPAAMTLAREEGLEAHERSIGIRLKGTQEE
tara:strand:- start:32451 stop:33758 length:1308 start_codon:yes stop_codon:yes gene_type:complete